MLGILNIHRITPKAEFFKQTNNFALHVEPAHGLKI